MLEHAKDKRSELYKLHYAKELINIYLSINIRIHICILQRYEKLYILNHILIVLFLLEIYML